MPNDMYTLNALSRELANSLVGGRIEKINQPEKDEVTFYVHTQAKTKILVVSVDPNSPRIHITQEKKDNPYQAPPFLMHLRKRFIGARIISLKCIGFDRVLELRLKGKNEMADEVTNKVYVELMGRYSNIIITEEDDVISEALKHITPDNSTRCILPKFKYELPSQNKTTPVDKEGVIRKLDAYVAGDLAKYISQEIAGFSLLTANELLFRANIDRSNPPTNEQKTAIADKLIEFYNINDSSLYNPSVRYQNGSAVDFFFMPYLSSGYKFTAVDSLNEAVRLTSIEKDRVSRLQSEGKQLVQVVKKAIQKCERNIANASQKIIECQEYESLRIKGELTTNNLYQLKKGATAFTTYNYYDDKNITIDLDPLLTPQQNAQAFYKKYAKQKRTIDICNQQLETLNGTLDYLKSLSTSLDLAENPNELDEIKLELIEYGLIKEKPQKGKVRKPKQLPPKEYSIEGFKVLRGRNNIENERVTFGYAQDTDIWMHVKDSHGSHLIIKTEGKKVPDSVIKTACEICAFYSEKQQSGNTIVDYTLKKHVRKRPGGSKGAVIYTDYKSAVVVPSAHKDKEGV